MNNTSSKTAGHKAGAASKANAEAVARRSTVNGRGWKSFTDAELVRAVELMVSPSDLAIREAALAVLKAFSYTPEDVADQLASGEYLNDGAAFDGLVTECLRIIQIEE